MHKDLDQSKISKKWLHQAGDIEVDFKPLSEGLGFHHHKMKLPQAQPTRKLPSLKTKSAGMNSSSYVEQHQHDLMAFYQKAKQEEVLQQNKMREEKIEKIYPSATSSQRVLAWILDQMFLLSLVSILLFIAERVTSAGILAALTQFSSDVWFAVGAMWVFFQLFYFTFTDRIFNQTIGQAIVGIEVKLNQEPDIMKNFLRGLIKVFSLLSLGVLAWYDIQSKATDTQVIRK
jgi:hypothetical protein